MSKYYFLIEGSEEAYLGKYISLEYLKKGCSVDIDLSVSKVKEDIVAYVTCESLCELGMDYDVLYEDYGICDVDEVVEIGCMTNFSKKRFENCHRYELNKDRVFLNPNELRKLIGDNYDDKFGCGKLKTLHCKLVDKYEEEINNTKYTSYVGELEF